MAVWPESVSASLQARALLSRPRLCSEAWGPESQPREPLRSQVTSHWMTHPGPGGRRDVVVALRVPEPDSVATGAGQPTQGTGARRKQRGPWGPAGARPPSSCREDATARRMHRGRGGQQTRGRGLASSPPPPQLPKEPGARPPSRQPQKSLGQTLKPSWSPPLDPSPGVPKLYLLQPLKMPPNFTGGLRPSHPSPQLSESPLSPPLGHQVPRLGHASRAWIPSAPSHQPSALSLPFFL